MGASGVFTRTGRALWALGDETCEYYSVLPQPFTCKISCAGNEIDPQLRAGLLRRGTTSSTLVQLSLCPRNQHRLVSSLYGGMWELSTGIHSVICNEVVLRVNQIAEAFLQRISVHLRDCAGIGHVWSLYWFRFLGFCYLGSKRGV